MFYNVAIWIGKLTLKLGFLLGVFWFSGVILVQGPFNWWDQRQSNKEYHRIFDPIDKRIAEQAAAREAQLNAAMKLDGAWAAVASGPSGEMVSFTGTLAECLDYKTTMLSSVAVYGVRIECVRN